LKIAEYLDIPLNERAGGVGTYIKSLSSEFKTLGHQVVVKDGLNMPRIFSNRHLVGLCKDADIHHFHEPSTAFVTWCTRTHLSDAVSAAVTFHAPTSSKLLDKPYSLVTRLLYRKASLVLTTTKRNADYLKSKGIYANVIPLWAEEFFEPNLVKRYVREPYVLSVCAVDNFHRYKNYRLISKLGNLLKTKFKMRLLHIGIHDFNIPHVVHCGPVTKLELRRLYQRATAFVLPSIGPYEGFGIAATEALRCATPVLVSDGCGISEFLDPFFVSPLNEFDKNLSNMIGTLLRNPSPSIDRAYQESIKFAYENCRKTVKLIIAECSPNSKLEKEPAHETG
jgi:glycosyltransferase involved in cell wall biosynthesis